MDPWVGQNVHEGVLFVNTTLYNKIHLKMQKLEKHFAGAEVVWSQSKNWL